MSEIGPFFSQLIVPAIPCGAEQRHPGPSCLLVEAREAEILRSFRIRVSPAACWQSPPSPSVHIATGAISLLRRRPSSSAPPALHFAFILVFRLSAGLHRRSLIGVVAGTSRSAILWQQLIYLPSMLLGGLMVPGHMLPELFVRIGHILPATYAMDAFLGLAYGQEILYSPMLAVAILTAGGVLAFVLAAWLFAWDSRSLQRRPVLSAALALLPYLAGALFLV